MSEATYVIRYTDAPEVYDGFSTRTITDIRTADPRKTKQGKLRAVMVDVTCLEWQENRNRSGGYSVFRADELDEMERAEVIVDDEGEDCVPGA